MLNGKKRRPAGPVLHRRLKAVLALAAVIAVFMSSGGIRPVHMDSGVWEREPYSACYLMFNTDPSDDENVNDGLMLEGQRAFAAAVMDILKAWENDTGTDLTSDALWGPVREWLDLAAGKQAVTPDRFPSTEPDGFFAAFQQTWTAINALDLPAEEKAVQVRTMLEDLVGSAAEHPLYFDPVTGRNFYIRVTTSCNESIPNKFRTSTGNYGYCLNWNYKFPKDQGADDIRDGEALKKTLGISDGQYNKLVNLLKLGFPTNTALPDAFADLPDEALRCGTQAAVWIHLCEAGAAGNDGPGPLTLEGMQDVTDPLLNPTPVRNLSSYVRYLLETADEAEASVPGAQLLDFEAGDAAYADGSFVSELRVSAKNCSEYVRLQCEGLPAGSVLSPLDDGTAVTTAEDGFHLSGYEGSGETAHVYRLTVPSTGNTGKDVTLTAAAVGKFTNTEMSIYWDENLIVDDQPTQIMSNIHVDEYPASSPLSQRLSLPYPDVLFLKTDAAVSGTGGAAAVTEETLRQTAGLPGASIRLLDAEGETVRTLSGEEVRFDSGTEGTLFAGVRPGTYRLAEDRTPEGYQKTEDAVITVADSGGVQAFLIGNERTYGTLRIVKRDRTDGTLLSGAGFGLFYAEDVTDRNGQTVFLAGEEVPDADGQPLGVFYTDDEGEAVMGASVPIGLYDENGLVCLIPYELREVVTPPGQYGAADPERIEFAYEGDGTPVVEKTLALTDPAPHLELHKRAERPTFTGRKEDTVKEEITVVAAGDTVVYVLTLTNEGAAPAFHVLIRDVLPEEVSFTDQETESLYGTAFLPAEDGRTLYWLADRIDPDETLTVRISAKVSGELSGKEAVFVNTAYYHMPADPETVPDPADPDLPWLPSEDVLYRTVTAPSYVFAAERLTEAPECLFAGEFGFFRDDTVWYRLKLENTGNTALEADLCVEPEDIAKNVLQELRFSEVSGAGVRWLNEETSKDTDVFPRISVEAGKTAEVLFYCRIAKDADEYAAKTPHDDPADASDGYVWYCRTAQVTSSYEIRIFDPLHPENEQWTVLPADETVFEALKPQYGAVNTPVQLRGSYELSKVRVSEAPEARQEEGRFGFRRTTDVRYEARIRNTGEVPLRMRVRDFFEEEAAAWFTLPRFLGVSGEGAVLLDEAGLSDGEPFILIGPGEEAVLPITAGVLQEAEPFTAPASMDDKEDPADGYVSTAVAYDVEAVYERFLAGPDGVSLSPCIRTEEEWAPLAQQQDAVNTPVQIVVGQVSGDTPDRTPSRPVVLGIDDRTERLLLAGLLVLSAAGAVAAGIVLFRGGKRRKEES